MKILLCWLLLIPVYLSAQSAGELKFIQEVPKIYSSKDGLPNGEIEEIFTQDNTPIAKAGNQYFELKADKWKVVSSTSKSKTAPKFAIRPDSKILSSIQYKGGYAIGCEKGLYLYNNAKKLARVFPENEKYNWALRNVNALVTDSKGRLWFGADEGVGYLDGTEWKLFAGKEGLPFNRFTCAAAAPDGAVWFGTEKGVIEVKDDYFKYRASRRWLPSDKVNDITVTKNGTVWIATDKGVGSIIPVTMTFDDKAKYFTKQVEERHNRMGFIAHSHLKEQFNVNSSEVAISDNDGMYTSMYGAAQAFRYAATGDPEAKALADRSFKACKWLVDITHEKGFPARVIIPADWHEPVNEIYSVESNLRHQKSDPMWKNIYPRFPKSKDGKYMYKIDTSSDELAGHFFFYGIYYDLVAKTEEEKKAVREVVGDIMDHLIRHGYKLVDHDGKVTRWGDFSPEYFSSVYGYDQRGLNSMVMLSFLNVAKHVTGDSKYEDAAKILRDKYNYHIYALHPKEFFPPENVVPWDNNICLMSMYGLLRYETDPALLLMYRQSLESAWQHISKQKNAFWDIIYASLGNRFSELVDKKTFEDKNLFKENHLYAPNVVQHLYKPVNNPEYILENLQKVPLDLIGYTMDNRHRLDVVFDNSPLQNENMGWRTDGYALPIDERGHVRQDRDGFALLASEGDGHDEHEGTFFLLPYYMAQYHGLLGQGKEVLGK
ncbi:two-component regulator propeller domain-containing protein [Dyadobacter sp. CY312]|uniref:two-component regulator propeller domain-containing protein n=1 Tax=Dyadobacter sp. CY312 TaxID=2907303 RepID=UPI001F3773D6|nr:two-component regulator propeller domain-containing protein [Dyadobacter sp. CY312]MCE7041075.1 hypothetical protein [Dyadobacter sp. CY312]